MSKPTTPQPPPDRLEAFKSIFPTFPVNVPMPADTAIPGSFKAAVPAIDDTSPAPTKPV